MLLPLFFFPKEKFKDKRQRGVWYAFLIGGMAIIFFLFVLPVLHHGLGMGDTRGGEGINASEQLWWILQLPGSYLQKLIGFMAGYLGFNVAPLYTTNMGYLGQGDYGILLLILIAVILYLDRGEEKRKVTWLRISPVGNVPYPGGGDCNRVLSCLYTSRRTSLTRVSGKVFIAGAVPIGLLSGN